jgi:hypothetical protein
MAQVNRKVSRRVLGISLLVVLVFAGAVGTVALAQQGDPDPDRDGQSVTKPQRDGTPTPDPVGPSVGSICASEAALCALAQELTDNLHDSAAWQLEDKLLPSEAACSEAGVSPVLRASACPGDSTGVRASGFTVVGLGKRPALLERQEFLDLIESWRALARGRDLAPLSVACAITVADTVDCQSAAVAVARRDRASGPVDAAFVFFVRRDAAGNWGLVGASGGLPDGSVLTGGPERRLMAGWTGNPTGAWYFELLPSSP